jgi:hypothetical protein
VSSASVCVRTRCLEGSDVAGIGCPAPSECVTNDPATNQQARRCPPLRVAVDCPSRLRHGRQRPRLRCPTCAYHSRVLIHDRYGVVLTVVAAVGAVAAIVSLFRPRILPLVRSYLRATIAVVAIQVAVGIVLVATGHAPQQLLHWFYGAATLLALPVAMLIGKRLGGREEQVWLAGGAVLTVLFALRAMATG